MVYWIWLSTLKNVEPSLQRNLLKRFGSPQNVFESGKQELNKVEGMNKYASESLLYNRSLDHAKEILERAHTKDIKLLRDCDPRYPPHAKESPVAPILLYYYGNLQVFDSYVAIVGIKECTSYGKQIANHLASFLNSFGMPVISSLESGTGYHVQQTCMRNHGYSIAFTAYGLDLCTPFQKSKKLEEMTEKGVVITATPPMCIPQEKHYNERNALISAWSKHIVVIEAEQQDDARMIAQLGRRYDRDLYVVPNQINRKTARGTNALLAEGATPYIGIESLKITRITNDEHSNLQDLWEFTREKYRQDILFWLSQSPLSIAILAKKLQTDGYTLYDQLVKMEQEGTIHIRGGMAFKI